MDRLYGQWPMADALAADLATAHDLKAAGQWGGCSEAGGDNVGNRLCPPDG